MGRCSTVVVRVIGNDEVGGPIPLNGTTLRPAGFGWQATLGLTLGTASGAEERLPKL